MAHRNERAPGWRGARGLLTHLDCSADSITLRQRELFGVAVEVSDRTSACAPCPRCRTTIAIIGPGAGPHHAELRCLRGHFLRWLPKPGGGA
jgi:hypothetical protein